MKSLFENVLIILFFAALVLLPMSCVRWQYKECKKVGHDTLYCVLQSAK